MMLRSVLTLVMAALLVDSALGQRQPRNLRALKARAKAQSMRRERMASVYRPTRPCNVATLGFFILNPNRPTQFSFCQVKKLMQDWLFRSPADVQEFVNAYFDTFDKDGEGGITLAEMADLDLTVIRPYRKKFRAALRIANPAPFDVRRLYETVDAEDPVTPNFLVKTEVRDYLVEKSFNRRSEGIHDWIVLAAFNKFDTQQNGKLSSEELKEVVCNVQPLSKESRAAYYCNVLETVLSSEGSELSVSERLQSIDPSLAQTWDRTAAIRKRFGLFSG